MTAMLIDGRFVAVFPRLVAALGGDMVAAAVLQAIHYRAPRGEAVTLSMAEIGEEVGLSADQARRACRRLADAGLITAATVPGAAKRWAVDHAAVAAMTPATPVPTPAESPDPLVPPADSPDPLVPPAESPDPTLTPAESPHLIPTPAESPHPVSTPADSLDAVSTPAILQGDPPHIRRGTPLTSAGVTSYRELKEISEVPPGEPGAIPAKPNFGRIYADAFTDTHGTPPTGTSIKRVAAAAARLVRTEHRDPAAVAREGHANLPAAYDRLVSAATRHDPYARGSKTDAFRVLAAQIQGQS